ncbi:hypothetical protein [Labilibaculum euxinus]
MKRLILLILFASVTLLASAQYDCSTNIPKTKISNLYGQTVTVIELNELYPDPEWKNNLTDTAIIGRQYTFVKAEKDSKRPQIWVELSNTEETIYYRLTSSNMRYPPILVNAYFEKQKQLYQNQKLRLKMDNEYTTTSGQNKLYNTSNLFTCAGTKLLKNGTELVPSYILTVATDTINVPLTSFENNRSNTIDRFIKQ